MLSDVFHQHKIKFFKYALIGVTGASVDFAIFIILYNFLNISPLIATVFSISAGIINNFILNVLFNFRVKNLLLKRFISFYTVGLFGLFISILIIFFASEVFSLNANISKIISLPIIVLLQYVLNTNLSFANTFSIPNMGQIIKNNKLFVILNIVFIVQVLFFMHLTPFAGPQRNGAPDEIRHYTYNVKYILEKHSLPVSGRDDLEAYNTCYDDSFGKIPCIVSYVVYPGYNYILSAGGAKAGAAIGLSEITGARLVSLGWGLIFVNLAYFLAYRIIVDKKWAALTTASVALIPQVTFISSYVNQDVHSLAISMLLVLSIILLKEKITYGRIYFLLGSVGLVLISKYNYFIYLLPVFIFILWLIKRHGIQKRFVIFAILSAPIALALPIIWYGRNYFLYHDFLGQNFMLTEMSKHHVLGKAHKLSLNTVAELGERNFLDYILRSFFAVFGYMTIYLKAFWYDLANTVLIYGSVFLIYDMFKKRDIYLIKILASWFVFYMAALMLLIYNSINFDYQPQGRYMFPILAPLILLFAYMLKQNKQIYGKYIIGSLALVICLIIQSDLLYIKEFLRVR